MHMMLYKTMCKDYVHMMLYKIVCKRLGREEGGGFRMGNTCIPVADSF